MFSKIISLIIAKKIKKKTHLYISLFQPISSSLIEPLKNSLRKFLLNIIFPINNPIAKRILITVGFIYINIGLLKKIVNPPKIDIRIAPTMEYRVFFFFLENTQLRQQLMLLQLMEGLLLLNSFPPLIIYDKKN